MLCFLSILTIPLLVALFDGASWGVETLDAWLQTPSSRGHIGDNAAVRFSESWEVLGPFQCGTRG
jgi:uncharacterized protein (DUF486 family)